MMSRLVKSTMASLEMDEQPTLVAPIFGPFSPIVLLLWMTEVALLADRVGQPSH